MKYLKKLDPIFIVLICIYAVINILTTYIAGDWRWTCIPNWIIALCRPVRIKMIMLSMRICLLGVRFRTRFELVWEAAFAKHCVMLQMNHKHFQRFKESSDGDLTYSITSFRMITPYLAKRLIQRAAEYDSDTDMILMKIDSDAVMHRINQTKHEGRSPHDKFH